MKVVTEFSKYEILRQHFVLPQDDILDRHRGDNVGVIVLPKEII